MKIDISLPKRIWVLKIFSIIVQYYLSSYTFPMKATQTVVVPDSHRLTTDVPPEVPAGPVILTFTPSKTGRKKERVFGCANGQYRMAEDFDEIEDVRLLLQKEMSEKGTSAVVAAAGDGWEAHVRKHYAES